jgi:hypothetical protein
VANLTYAQLEGLWIQAGGSSATAPIAAAIAEAESGGNATVTSSNPDGGTNVGPWQLDTLGVGSGYSVAQLQDPSTNAAIAVRGSSNGTNWSDWETYVNGAYKAFLSSGTTPDTTGLPAASTTTATLTSASATGTACALSVPIAGCILPKSALRGVLGGLCLGAAGILGLTAAVILAASAFEHSGAARAVAQAVPPVRATVAVAQRAAPRGGGARQGSAGSSPG